MNLSQIIEALPLQVYVRRGELVIHFSTPADLIGRLTETSAALPSWTGKPTSRGPTGRLTVEPDAALVVRFRSAVRGPRQTLTVLPRIRTNRHIRVDHSKMEAL